MPVNKTIIMMQNFKRTEMKIIRFLENKKSFIGVLRGDEILRLDVRDDMNEFIKNDLIKKIDSLILDNIALNTVKLLAPMASPLQDIICLGINFLEHAKESASFKKEEFKALEEPVYFGKRVNYFTNPNDEIYLNPLTSKLDYEAELALIISKDCKNVEPESVKNYIFGYSIINDISARDIQLKHKQWYAGKSLEGSCPMGPCIKVGLDTSSLNIKSFVNGELRQNSNTDKLIFNIDFVVSQLSKYFTLKACTIISMGTPSGVGMGFTPPKFLKSGDIVSCEIQNIGSIENSIK